MLRPLRVPQVVYCTPPLPSLLKHPLRALPHRTHAYRRDRLLMLQVLGHHELVLVRQAMLVCCKRKFPGTLVPLLVRSQLFLQLLRLAEQTLHRCDAAQ